MIFAEGKRCSAVEILVCYALLYDSTGLLNLFQAEGVLNSELHQFIEFTTNKKDYIQCKNEGRYQKNMKPS